MKLHEFQSKALLKSAGLPIPKSIHIESAIEVADAIKKTQIKNIVVKAQAFTGGRGKAGGIKLFDNVGEATEFTDHLIGMQLVTHQTGPEGVLIESVLLEEACNIDKEFYVAILLDRAKANPVIMISPDGGIDIEDVAEKTPERILRLYPEVGKELSDKIKKQGADFLKLSDNLKLQFADILTKLYNVYLDRDATLLEINPLVLTKEKQLLIVDCKFDIDINAIYRQMDSGGDPNAEKSEAEIEASKYAMSYIPLEGNIGCMVNGAGLAMATMDSINHNGGNAANFLDVGGSATEEAITKAFEIILNDKAVEVILVNIFGGIMRCDIIANGIVAAVSKSGLKIPLVVRLEGNNVKIGQEIIKSSGLDILSVKNLDDAAKKAVSLTKN